MVVRSRTLGWRGGGSRKEGTFSNLLRSYTKKLRPEGDCRDEDNCVGKTSKELQ